MTTIFNPATVLDSTGLHMPRLDEILAYLEGVYRTVYGANIDLDPESPDGQVVGIEAEMFSDLADLVSLIYQGLASPNGATGSLLANLVLLNGLAKNTGVPSTATVTIEGTAGSTAGTGFIVKGTINGKLFSPVAPITIATGQTTATGIVHCTENGDVEVAAGELTKIMTVTTGIVSVTNVGAGTKGYYTEGDGALRARRVQSVALPSQSMTDGLQAEIINMVGVRQATVWENDGDSARAMNGGSLDPHSLYVVVDVEPGSDVDPDTSSDPDPIAEVIYNRKSGGCSMMGDVDKTITDEQGHDNIIHYDKATEVDIYVAIVGTEKYGWPTTGGQDIKDAITAWAAGSSDVNGTRNIAIGGDSNGQLSWTDVLSSFIGEVPGFNLTSLQLGTNPGSMLPQGVNVDIDFDSIARIEDANISVTVT